MILQIKFINCYSILTFLEAHMLHQIGQTNLLLTFLPYKSQKEDIKHPLMNFVGVNAWFTHHSIHGLPWSALVMPNAWQIFVMHILPHLIEFERFKF